MRWLVIVLALVACGREPKRIDVGAASSLRYAMPELVEKYRKATGIEVGITYGASDNLAGEVERGAKLDALVLADAAAIDRLVGAQHIPADSRRAIATTSIVLVGPVGVDIKFATLTTLHGNAKIAIGDPATVPIGRYARTYLEKLGAWPALQDRLIFGGDVAGVLVLAKQGRARFAIVYRTDLRAAAPLVALDAPDDAPTASFAAGVATHSPHAAAARAFVDYLASAEAAQILERYGFGPAAK